MKILNKIKKFINLDIRWKLKFLGGLIGLKLYPSSFKLSGLKSIYSKIIFYLIFQEKSKEIRKKNYELIFKTNLKNNRKNILVALPRSGSNFLRNLITSYVAIEHNISNGVPKYDGVLDRWKRLSSTIFSGNMYNSITLDDEDFKIKKILNEEELQKKIIYFTRHPIQPADLIDINFCNPVILLRNPKTQVRSWILTKAFAYKYKYNDFLKELNKQIERNFEFLIFWKNYVDQNSDKSLIVDFDDLSSSTEKVLSKVLKFYDYLINKDILERSVEINSKTNYKKYIGNINKKSLRFMSDEISIVNEDNYNKLIKENKRIKDVFEIYNYLNNLKN